MVFPRVRRANDLQIDELMRKYCEHPVFVIIDVRADVVGVPVKGYAAVDTLSDDSQQTTLEFSHVDTIIDATESEEVGVGVSKGLACCHVDWFNVFFFWPLYLTLGR